MARLVGFISNRPDLCNRFAEHEREVLCCRRAGAGTSAEAAEEPAGGAQPWGWGVGFFQSGEILLKRRPLDDRAELAVADMLEGVRSDIHVAQVRRATIGSLRTDNTHPFRYRQWMFADTGTVDSFGELRPRLLEALPKFLHRSVRGDTDCEVLFHLFLSFLHDAGQLERSSLKPAEVFTALKSSLALLDRMAPDDTTPSRLNILLGSPEHLFAVHRGAPMAYRILSGREAFEPLFEDNAPQQFRMADLEPCRMAVVASDFEGDAIPRDWTPLPQQAMVAFSRTDDPVIVSKR